MVVFRQCGFKVNPVGIYTCPKRSSGSGNWYSFYLPLLSPAAGIHSQEWLSFCAVIIGGALSEIFKGGRCEDSLSILQDLLMFHFDEGY